MTPEKRREIARLGGKAAHEKGRAHQFTPNEAREAGRKGGLSVSKNRQHMAEIGRAGGKARGGGRPAAEPGMSSSGAGASASLGAETRPNAEVFQFPQGLEQVLRDLPFPASKQQVLERAGDQAIAIGEGERRPLRQLLERGAQDEFGSFAEISEAVDRALRESHAA